MKTIMNKEWLRKRIDNSFDFEEMITKVLMCDHQVFVANMSTGWSRNILFINEGWVLTYTTLGERNPEYLSNIPRIRTRPELVNVEEHVEAITRLANWCEVDPEPKGKQKVIHEIYCRTDDDKTKWIYNWTGEKVSIALSVARKSKWKDIYSKVEWSPDKWDEDKFAIFFYTITKQKW